MKPPKFYGTEDAVRVHTFLSMMAIYLYQVSSCQRLNDQGRISYFTCRLAGEAYEWSREVDQASLSYDEFVVLFKRRFTGQEQISPVLIELRHLKQDGPVESYNDKFKTLAHVIPDSWLSAKAKLSFYLDGLKESLQETVQDLKTAMKLSVEMQNSYRESGSEDHQ